MLSNGPAHFLASDAVFASSVRLIYCLLITLPCLFLSSLSSASITVEDAHGRALTLAQPAQRIVALAPHIVENTFSAGAGEKLVGVVSYSDYPEQAKLIPQVGTSASFSLEAVIALKPDLVLLWASGNGVNTLDHLARLNIPVYVSEPRQLADIPKTIRDIGQLAGTEIIGDAEANRITMALQNLEMQYRSQTRKTVLYQVWNEPLQTVNGEHSISRVIELCGGENVFADALPLAPIISLESVLERNPDAIVASGMDSGRPEWLDMWLAYPSLLAVQHKGLFFIHPDHIQRPTARLLIGAEGLCEQLDTLRQQP